MVTLTRSIDIFSDGSLFAQVSPSQLPDPVECPDGFVVGPERNGHVARINHDPIDYPRTVDLTLKITNEIEKTSPLLSNGTGVDPRSKVTTNITSAWAGEFLRLNGPWVTSRLFALAVGWFDTGYPTFSLLQCGGNLVEFLAGGFQYPGWGAINYQAKQNGPTGKSYLKHPQLVEKQVLVAGDKVRRLLIDKGADGGYGDTYIPLIADEQPYLSLWGRSSNQNGVTFYPDLPLQTKLYGVDVTITRYCFYGSGTYVEVDGLWYLGEQMLVTGGLDDLSRGGDENDRRTYCDALQGMPCPPPVIGWTRQE